MSVYGDHKETSSQQESMALFGLTRHAVERLDARRIPLDAVEKALLYGRLFFTRGAKIYAIGRKEVARYRKHGIDLKDYEGIQVVCADDDTVMTAYRNRDFRGLRPHHHYHPRRSSRFSHNSSMAA